MNLPKLFSLLLLFGLLNGTIAQTTNEDYGGYDIKADNYNYDQDLHEYYKAMQLYILDKSAEPMPSALKQMIADAENDGVNFTKGSMVHLIREYWTLEYVKSFPQPTRQNSAENDLPTICDNGGFEDDFTGYERYKSISNLNFPKCEPKIGSSLNGYFPVDWIYLDIIPATYPNDHPFDFKIMNPGLDPNIDPTYTIEQVLFGNKSLKINENRHSLDYACTHGQNGINKITKEFVVDSSTEIFAIWYACLLQDPTGHENKKPYFSIKFYDSNDEIVDELCWDSTEDFFVDVPPSNQSCDTIAEDLKLQPWKCDIFNFTGYTGQNLRLEITTADCGQGGHFSYAYIDGICDQCVQIDIKGHPVMCEDYEVCGTYTTYDTGGTTLQLDSLWAILYSQDSTEMIIPINNIDLITQSFCLTIPKEEIALDSCYDIRVFGTFSDGTGRPLNIGSASLNSGPYNDICSDDLFGDVPLNYFINTTCYNIGDPMDITNDQFSFELIIDMPIYNSYNWEIIMDGVSTIAQGTGSDTIISGPFNYQDCHFFDLYVPELDKAYPIQLEYECDGCVNNFRICQSQIDCESYGSPDPNDHTWSITFEIEGPEIGQWFSTNGLTGQYNTQYTFQMGPLNNYGNSVTFEIIGKQSGCRLFYTVELPDRCIECNLDYEIIISDCKENSCELACYSDPVYEVYVQYPSGLLTCKPNFCQVLNQGECVPIDIFGHNNGIYNLGIYDVGDGPWTLRIFDCDGCSEDIVIWPPDCQDLRDPNNINPINLHAPTANESEDNFLFVPNPTNGNLEIVVKDLDVENMDIELYSIYGKQMMAINKEINNLKIDIQTLPTGVYHLVIKSNGKLLTIEKIVKI